MATYFPPRGPTEYSLEANPDIYVPTMFGDAPESLIAKLKPTFDKLDALFDMNIIGKAVSYRMAEMMRNRLSTGTRPDGTSGMPYGTTTGRPLGKATGISLSIHAEISRRGYGGRAADEIGLVTNATSEWVIKADEIAHNQMRRVLRGVPFRPTFADLEKETRRISIMIIKGEPLSFPEPPGSAMLHGTGIRRRRRTQLDYDLKGMMFMVKPATRLAREIRDHGVDHVFKSKKQGGLGRKQPRSLNTYRKNYRPAPDYRTTM